MGIVDRAKEMADKAMGSGKAEQFIDKAADKVDDMTGHRYGDTIDKGADMAKQAARKGTQQNQQSAQDQQQYLPDQQFEQNQQ